MKIKFIVNPNAGRGKGKRRLDELKETLMNYEKKQWEIVVTQKAGETSSLAKQAVAEGYGKIVAVGGDGTINEVLNGIVDSTAILGIIPAGTGNDLARSLNIPGDMKECVEKVFTGKPVSLDVGKVNGRFFLNAAGVGLDAQIVKDVNRGFRYVKGPVAYYLSLLKNLISFSPQRLKIHLDEETVDIRGFVAAVCNGKFYGGGMMMAPHASYEDGKLDVIVVKEMNKIVLLKVFPAIYKGEHINRPEVLYYKSTKVIIETDTPMAIQTDGEIAGETPEEFFLYRGKVKIML